jgi:hypothetical protein
MNQFFIKVRNVIEVLYRPLMLLTLHAIRLDNLSELLGKRAQVVGEHAYT